MALAKATEKEKEKSMYVRHPKEILVREWGCYLGKCGCANIAAMNRLSMTQRSEILTLEMIFQPEQAPDKPIQIKDLYTEVQESQRRKDGVESHLHGR